MTDNWKFNVHRFTYVRNLWVLHSRSHESNSGMDMATRKCQKIEPYKDGYWIVFGWLGVHGVVGGFYRCVYASLSPI